MIEEKHVDYYSITETPGLGATKEQAQRLYQRYRFAKSFVKGKEVLEVACGSGMGLAYLAEEAAGVIGGDIDEKNVSLAKKHLKDNKKIDIRLMNAHDIGLPDESVDLVILFEAIYYLRDPKKFIEEVCRVLRKDGSIIMCSVNKDWEDFHPSPYTYRYFSVPELKGLLKSRFTGVNFYGGFPVSKEGVKDRTVSCIKRVALKFNFIPGSLKARSYLKRIFIGELTPLPKDIYSDMAAFDEPCEIMDGQVNKDYKIIYAVANKPRSR